MLRSPLSARAGVSPSRLYLPKEDWPSLLAFLLQRFPYIEPAIVQARLARGDMVSQTGEVYQLDSPYVADSWLWYYREVDPEIRVPFDIQILYQDQTLIVIDKPHFLASIPGGRYLQETALVRLRRLLDNEEISPIHRLDRDTAGLLLFCADKRYRGAYQNLFQSRAVEKTYECVAPYRPELVFPLRRESYIEKSPSYFTMQERAHESAMQGARVSILEQSQERVEVTSNSQTDISIIRHDQKLAHYLLVPLTGKKHQLRVHMNALGLSICGDEFYPELLPVRAADDFSRPLQLLAREIRFVDPVTGQERSFKSQRELAMVASIG